MPLKSEVYFSLRLLIRSIAAVYSSSDIFNWDCGIAIGIYFSFLLSLLIKSFILVRIKKIDGKLHFALVSLIN